MFQERAVRYRQIVEILLRHGLGYLVGNAPLPRLKPFEALKAEANREKYSPQEHLRLALEEMGPVAVKLGQTLATREDLTPESYRRELAKLQDSTAPVDGETIVQVVESELGAGVDTLFARFDRTPLASASLGQAHAAVLQDGREVVLKIRRPGVVDQVEQDLEILQNLAATASRSSRTLATVDLVGLTDEFATTLRSELDYLKEGRSAEQFAQNFAGNPALRIPAVHWESTTSRVLTMERVGGIKIDDVAALDAAGIDRPALAVRATQMIAQMIFEDGYFHADPHPGNLFVEEDGRIALIDFGMVGTLDAQLRTDLGTLLGAVVRKSPRRIAHALVEVAPGRQPVDMAALTRDIGPIVNLYAGKTLAEFKMGPLLRRVFGVLRRHHLQLPREIALLLRMIMMAEGMGVTLDQDFQLGSVLSPYVRAMLMDRYAPTAVMRRLAETGTGLLELADDLPEQFRRLQTMLDTGGPEVHLRADEFEPLVDRVGVAGQRFGAALIGAAIVRGMTQVATAEPERRRRWHLPALGTGLAATTVYSGYLGWLDYRRRRAAR